MDIVVSRFDVFLIRLDPTQGREIRKTRPCLIISPDEMNRHIGTVMVAPMTTRGRSYPSRVHCRFQGRDGQIVLDQLRGVDRRRLTRKLGRIDSRAGDTVLTVLAEIFAR